MHFNYRFGILKKFWANLPLPLTIGKSRRQRVRAALPHWPGIWPEHRLLGQILIAVDPPRLPSSSLSHGSLAERLLLPFAIELMSSASLPFYLGHVIQARDISSAALKAACPKSPWAKPDRTRPPSCHTPLSKRGPSLVCLAPITSQ